MGETIEGGKELLSETVKAFKTGLHGDDYVPGSGGSPAVHQEEQLSKLDELHASGTLSDHEYQTARARLLGVSEAQP